MEPEIVTATHVPEVLPAKKKRPPRPAKGTQEWLDYQNRAQQKTRDKKKARETKEAGKWYSQDEVTKSGAKEILTERGIKNTHVVDLLWDLLQDASRHFKIPLNEYLFRAGLRTTLSAIEQKKQLDPPVVEGGLVLGESELCVETLYNPDLHAIWDVSLIDEPDVTYESFKKIRYRAKTDAYFLGTELLARDFSKCHREWIDNFYPVINPDGLVPDYTQAQSKNWWTAQIANQPREYLQLASRASFKSSTAVVFLISIILQYPDVRTLLVSEVSKLSKDFIKSLRFFFENPPLRFTRYFPEHQIAPGDGTVLTYETPMARLGLPQPTAHAIGMDSSAQGLRANIVLVDDPISVLTVKEEDQRKASLEKYLMLKNVRERDGLVFLVGTPYHPQDLFKSILDQNQKSPDGSFRSRIDPAFRILPHASFKPLLNLEPGDVELLFEEQLPFEELRRALKSDERFFRSQQLCQFVELTETIKLQFDEDVLKAHVRNPGFFEHNPKYRLIETVQGTDCSRSTKNTADFSAIGTVKIYLDTERNKFLLVVVDMVMERLRLSEVAIKILQQHQKWSPQRALIEKDSYHEALQVEIDKAAVLRGIPISHWNFYWKPVQGKNVKDRALRVKALEGLLASDQLYFTNSNWTELLINQFVRFDGIKKSGSSDISKDDGPDCVSAIWDSYGPREFGEVTSEAQTEAEQLAFTQRLLAEQHAAYFGTAPGQVSPRVPDVVEIEQSNPLWGTLSKHGMTR